MNNRKPRLYPAHLAGIALLIAAAGVFFISPWISAIILISYIILCVVACFAPETNILGPVISRGRTGLPIVSLTFDDGPSDRVTPLILDLLDRHQVKATFFVSGVNAQNHPDIIADIINRGHGVGNHSYHHFPHLMLKSRRSLYDEIFEAQAVLRAMGIETKAFRPPVGIVNPKLAGVLKELDLLCITFSCRAYDAGNRRIKDLSGRILKKVKADDIILLHDIPARDDTEGKYLLSEMEIILAGVRNKGLRIAPLDELVGREIMARRLLKSGVGN